MYCTYICKCSGYSVRGYESGNNFANRACDISALFASMLAWHSAINHLGSVSKTSLSCGCSFTQHRSKVGFGKPFRSQKESSGKRGSEILCFLVASTSLNFEELHTFNPEGTSE